MCCLKGPEFVVDLLYYYFAICVVLKLKIGHSHSF